MALRIVLRLWCNSLAISRIDLRFRKYSRRMISFWSTVIISSTPLAQDVAHTSCNQKSGYGGPLFYCHFLAKWSPFVFPYTPEFLRKSPLPVLWRERPDGQGGGAHYPGIVAEFRRQDL